MNYPKAIETVYHGYRFRSRLEARWAVFFDAMGWPWEYEKEGYDLGDGINYLPDFWLPQIRMWAEVKPEPFTPTETEKAKRLVRMTRWPCLKLVGVPDDKPYMGFIYDEVVSDKLGEILEIDFFLTNYHGYPQTERRVYCCGSEDERFDDTADAADRARAARFEHEDRGGPKWLRWLRRGEVTR